MGTAILLEMSHLKEKIGKDNLCEVSPEKRKLTIMKKRWAGSQLVYTVYNGQAAR